MQYLYLNQSEWLEDESGLRVSKNLAADTAFTDEQQNNLLELEQDSWWFQYRAEVIINLMKKFFDLDKITLDIGAGNGYTSMLAQEQGFTMGIIEPSPAACKNALKRGIKEVNCGTVTETSINDNSIAQVLLLDVIEHIENDNEFIALIKRKTTETGGGYSPNHGSRV